MELEQGVEEAAGFHRWREGQCRQVNFCGGTWVPEWVQSSGAALAVKIATRTEMRLRRVPLRVLGRYR